MNKYKVGICLTPQAIALKQSCEYPIDVTPKKVTDLAMGFDMFYCGDSPVDIYPNEIVKLPTGVRLNLLINPEEPLCAYLRPNSSNKKLQLTNSTGMIDPDYIGEVKFSVVALLDEKVTINPGERIGQLEVRPYYKVEGVVIEDTGLPVTERGTKGFGELSKLKHDGLNYINDPKYGVTREGKLVNYKTGSTIPEDEPIIILRARDRHAVKALKFYKEICEVEGHRAAVETRIKEFSAFAEKNPDRMQEPGNKYINDPTEDLTSTTARFFTFPSSLDEATGELVENFASAMAFKLNQAQFKYGHTVNWKFSDWEFTCKQALTKAVSKGDPIDVANYSAFHWYHGWTTN